MTHQIRPTAKARQAYDCAASSRTIRPKDCFGSFIGHLPVGPHGYGSRGSPKFEILHKPVQ